MSTDSRFTYMGDNRCSGSFWRSFLRGPRRTTLVRRLLRRCTGLAILLLIDADHVDDLPCTTEMKRMRKESKQRVVDGPELDVRS